MPAQVPASIEAEQAILGSLLLYPQTADLAYEEDLKPSDFFLENNRRIYQVIMTLQEEKKPIDSTTVMTRLTDLQQLNSVGGAEYFSHLTDVAISATNSEYYIDTIKEKALLRRLIEVAEKIKSKAYEEQYDPADVLAEAEGEILKISRERKTSDFTTSSAAFDAAIDALRERSRDTRRTGVESGYEALDRFTNGFQKGELTILAARPAVGKTALALNFAVNAALKGKTVALFSLEMSVNQLANRMLACKSAVESDKIKTGQRLTNDDWAKIDSARDQLSRSNLYIDDSSFVKVNDIMAKCRKLQSENGLDLVIIDYLQLISSTNSRSDNRQQDIAEISRNLKILARELNIPVIALSQINREVEKAKREPVLADLRESGAIEQDADIVMFIHKPTSEVSDEEKEELSDVVDLKIIVAKQRNGATGSLWLAFDKKTNTFYNKVYAGE